MELKKESPVELDMKTIRDQMDRLFGALCDSVQPPTTSQSSPLWLEYTQKKSAPSKYDELKNQLAEYLPGIFRLDFFYPHEDDLKNLISALKKADPADQSLLKSVEALFAQESANLYLVAAPGRSSGKPQLAYFAYSVDRRQNLKEAVCIEGADAICSRFFRYLRAPSLSGSIIKEVESNAIESNASEQAGQLSCATELASVELVPPYFLLDQQRRQKLNLKQNASLLAQKSDPSQSNPNQYAFDQINAALAEIGEAIIDLDLRAITSDGVLPLGGKDPLTSRICTPLDEIMLAAWKWRYWIWQHITSQGSIIDAEPSECTATIGQIKQLCQRLDLRDHTISTAYFRPSQFIYEMLMLMTSSSPGSALQQEVRQNLVNVVFFSLLHVPVVLVKFDKDWASLEETPVAQPNIERNFRALNTQERAKVIKALQDAMTGCGIINWKMPHRTIDLGLFHPLSRWQEVFSLRGPFGSKGLLCAALGERGRREAIVKELPPYQQYLASISLLNEDCQAISKAKEAYKVLLKMEPKTMALQESEKDQTQALIDLAGIVFRHLKEGAKEEAKEEAEETDKDGSYYRNLYAPEDMARFISRHSQADSHNAAYLRRLAQEISEQPNPKRKMQCLPLEWANMLDEFDAQFANMHELSQFLREQFSLRSLGDARACWPPVLLVGPPSAGKTAAAMWLGKRMNLSFRRIDMGQQNTLSTLGGSQDFWSNAQPGMVFEALVKGRMLNPILMLDELDKAVQLEYRDAAIQPLHTLLEPDTAKTFRDNAVKDVRLDTRFVNWIATANDLTVLPGSILSRMRVIEVKMPDKAQCKVIAKTIYQEILSELFMQEDGDTDRAQAVFSASLSEAALERFGTVAPRDIRRTLQQAMGRARNAGRKAVEPQDIDVETNQGKSDPKIGFLSRP